MSRGIYKRKPFTKKHRENISISLYKGWDKGIRHSRVEKIFIECKQCKKSFSLYLTDFKRGKKFCSKECYTKFMQGKNHHNWQGGISREPYGFDFNEELKILIRKRDSYKCQLCGAPQEEFTKALPIHHIDYDKHNNEPKNLITLCISCNGRVNINKEYWKNYFSEKTIYF